MLVINGVPRLEEEPTNPDTYGIVSRTLSPAMLKEFAKLVKGGDTRRLSIAIALFNGLVHDLANGTIKTGREFAEAVAYVLFKAGSINLPAIQPATTQPPADTQDTSREIPPRESSPNSRQNPPAADTSRDITRDTSRDITRDTSPNVTILSAANRQKLLDAGVTKSQLDGLLAKVKQFNEIKLTTAQVAAGKKQWNEWSALPA
jgi:hypothetical protein